ncbi:MAG TPA: hypothetical protein VGW34_08855 [Allosphingosinicella sp.]|nr:hypothetical protein [Allosphingosinicella sp.]
MRLAVKMLLPLSLLLAGGSAFAQLADEAVRPRLERLAAAGNAQAAYHLGMMYHLGLDGTPKDQAKALELFRKAAEAGDPLGAYKLGDYYDGQGAGLVEGDPEAALQHKLVAARAGYSVAQRDVARLLYAKGETGEAVRWLEAAARQGDQEAMQALSSLYSGEGKVARHMGKSLAYLVLLHNASKKKPTERIQAWLRETRAKLSRAELAEAEDIVRLWQVKPTPLTLQALAGKNLARKLAEQAPEPAAGAAAEPPASETPAAEAAAGATQAPGAPAGQAPANAGRPGPTRPADPPADEAAPEEPTTEATPDDAPEAQRPNG